MKKVHSLLPPLIGIIFCIIFLTYLQHIMKEEREQFRKKDSEMKSHVGDTVFIMKDTLIIIDYSYYIGEYTLSNGIKVSKEIVK